MKGGKKMSEVKVYMIANLQIHDAENYRNYEKGFFPILKKHGGEFITYDDDIVNVEGENNITGRVIIFSFPNEEAADKWYNDPEYQEISKFRREATTTQLIKVKGMPPR